MISLNNNPINFMYFPNGERRLDKNEFYKINSLKDQIVTMKMSYESDQDIIDLMYLKSFLDSINAKAYLHIPYMPYSRMDRTENKTIFTLKYVANFINSLNFSKVIIDEPHSDVCVALLDRVRVRNTTVELLRRLPLRDNTYIVFPDAGAEKRYSKQIKFMNTLSCTKNRDFDTGRILSLEINEPTPKEPFEAIIVDDLSSFGGTFILTAKKLKEIGATKVTLVITHAEKSILEGDILKTDYVDKVITSDSILRDIHLLSSETAREKIKIINIPLEGF